MESFTIENVDDRQREAFKRALGINDTLGDNLSDTIYRNGCARAASFLTAYRLLDIQNRLTNQAVAMGPVTYPRAGPLKVILGMFGRPTRFNILCLGSHTLETK